MIRLLLDQGVPRSTASFLSPNEWDVIHVAAIGMATATDQEIIEYARQQNRICLTLDADFHAILAVNQLSSPSIIRIRREGLKGNDIANLLNQTKESSAPPSAKALLLHIQKRMFGFAICQ